MPTAIRCSTGSILKRVMQCQTNFFGSLPCEEFRRGEACPRPTGGSAVDTHGRGQASPLLALWTVDKSYVEDDTSKKKQRRAGARPVKGYSIDGN
jgi:hypothetical protein